MYLRSISILLLIFAMIDSLNFSDIVYSLKHFFREIKSFLRNSLSFIFFKVSFCISKCYFALYKMTKIIDINLDYLYNTQKRLKRN